MEDIFLPDEDKRWVVVSPAGARESRLRLARPVGERQQARIGDQTGGRVGLFLYTDDFWRDYRGYQAKGVEFVREPKVEAYGTVAVFRDLYGNLWDLLEPASSREAPAPPPVTASSVSGSARVRSRPAIGCRQRRSPGLA